MISIETLDRLTDILKSKKSISGEARKELLGAITEFVSIRKHESNIVMCDNTYLELAHKILNKKATKCEAGAVNSAITELAERRHLFAWDRGPLPNLKRFCSAICPKKGNHLKCKKNPYDCGYAYFAEKKRQEYHDGVCCEHFIKENKFGKKMCGGWGFSELGDQPCCASKGKCKGCTHRRCR